MTDTAQLLLDRVLALSEAERGELVSAVLRSFDGPLPTSGEQAEIDAAWAAAIRHRVTSYREGKATLIDADEVFASLRTRARQ